MKSRVFAGLGFFLCILPLSGLGAPRDREVVLLAAECQNENGGCARQDLVAYTFRNGKQVAKDTVLSSDVLYFDLGKNQIYQDRYVITHWADVIDLRNKKLLHKGDGELVGLEGDRVIEYVRKWEIDGYFYFDLKTGERGPLAQPGKWALPGVLSPKQTKSVSACELSVNRIMGTEVWMFTLDGQKKRLATDFSAAGNCPQVSILWLDDDQFLIQRRDGQIFIMKTDATVQSLARMPIMDPAHIQPYFERDPDGRVIYAAGERRYRLDPESRAILAEGRKSLGHGFEAASIQAFDTRFRFHGREIGRLWSCSGTAFDGYLAMEYGDFGSNLGYPKGLKVWSEDTGEWATLSVPWSIGIIGWMEKESSQGQH